MEAQAAGKPVVSTNVGAIKEVVIQEESGFIVDIADTTTFARSLKQLIENKNLRSAMGAKGRAHIQNHFSLHNQVEATKALYSSLTYQS